MHAPETDTTVDQEPWKNGDPLPDALDRKLSSHIHECLSRIADAAAKGDVETTLQESRHLRSLHGIRSNRRLLSSGRIRAAS